MKKTEQDAMAFPKENGRERMGSVYKHTYTEKQPDGSVRTYKSKKWYIEFRTPDGRRVRRPGYTDRPATEFLLSQMEQEAARVHAGMLPSGIGLTRISLEAHLLDFLAHLQAKGTTESHRNQVESSSREIMKACGFEKWANLSAAKVSDYLAGRRAKGLAIQSSNHLLRKFRSFVTWLSRKVQAYDPLSELKILNAETDRRRVRRSLTDEQFAALVKAAERGGTAWRLSGSDRAMLYQMAAFSGLRASELASLTPESLSLDSQPPTVTVQAGSSKHRREDVLPIPLMFAAKLKKWLQNFNGGRLWPGCWASQRQAAAMLRVDMGAAAIPYWDEQGRIFDFHSLRVQYITSLARAGVPLAVAQKLARHSDPRLTANTYSRLDICDLAGAVERLASPRPAEPGGKAVGRNRRKTAG